MSTPTLSPLRTSLLTLSLLALPLFATAAPAQVRLVVDLSARKLYGYSNGELVRTYDVAIGTKSHPTPTGSFGISRIIWNPGWNPPDREWARDEIPRKPGDPANPMRGVKLVFKSPYYYIHGTNAPSSIGEAASHGCIRMTESDAESLAQWVQNAGGARRSAEWYREVRGSHGTREVGLPDPIPLVIRS